MTSLDDYKGPLRYSKRLFEEAELARLYQLNRFDYGGLGLGEQLVNSLSYKLHQVPLSCAVDIGCGTGFLTRVLSAHFTKVIGVDCSLAQLEEAKRVTPQTNIEYRVGSAEDLFFIPNETATLMTVALAIHYFEPDQFFSEVDRILLPSGCLFVLHCYNPLKTFRVLPDTTNTEVITKCEDLMTEIENFFFQQFYKSTQQRIIELPKPPGYLQEKVFEVKASRLGTVDDLVNLFKSCGIVQKYLKMNEGQTNVIDGCRSRLLKILGEVSATPEDVKLTIASSWNCWLFRKPQTKNSTDTSNEYR